jgi:hypothetical protein
MARKGARRGRPRRDANLDFGGVLGNLEAAERALAAQRSDIDSKIAAIRQAIRAMGGAASVGSPAAAVRVAAAGPGRGRHGPRPGSLKEYIVKVLSAAGGAMAVKDITAGVLKAGFKTRNKTLAKSVGIALTDTPGVVKVGRGRFRLR